MNYDEYIKYYNEYIKYKKKYIKLKYKIGGSKYINVIVGEKDFTKWNSKFIFFGFENDFIIRYMKNKKYLHDKPVTIFGWNILEIDNGIFFDVGANIGTISIPLSKISPFVYSFEPQKELCKILQKNCIENDVKNIKINNVAVGHKNKKTELNNEIIDYDKITKIDYNTTNSMNYGALSLGKGGEKVKMITLDYYVKKNKIKDIKLIKVDAEGAEPIIFFGARKMINKFRPAIIFEKLPNLPNFIKKITKEVNDFDIITYCNKIGYKYIVELPRYSYVLLNNKKYLNFCKKDKISLNVPKNMETFVWNYTY